MPQQSMPSDLAGRVALVTGGSRGLGREIAQGFADAGATVVVSSRRAGTCEDVAAAIRAGGGTAHAIACHVGRWDEVDRLADETIARCGRVDVLVNNAGIAPLYPSPEELTEELWDKVLAVNLKGPYRLMARIGALMARGDGGAIVNVTSIAARRPSGEVLPYAAAKAGLNTLTLGFAEALGPKVRVNAIMAGPFLTDIAAGWDMEAFEAGASAFPLRRAGQPHEVVGAALYLASDAASFTTGAILPVDGGALLGRPPGT